MRPVPRQGCSRAQARPAGVVPYPECFTGDAQSRVCAGGVRQAGQAQRGQPTLASPPGALGPRHQWGQSVNSQARLWVLGALVHPWLLSRQDFPGIRCCLGNPGGRSHVSPTRKGPAECPHPQPGCRCVGPGLPQRVGVPRTPAAKGLAACSEPRLAKVLLPLPLAPHLCWNARLACGLAVGQRPAGALALLPLAPLSPGGPRRPGRPASPWESLERSASHPRDAGNRAGAGSKRPGLRGCTGSSSDPGPVRGAVVLLLQRPGQPAGWTWNSHGARELGRAAPRGLGGRWFHGWGPLGTAELPDRHTVLSWPHTGIFGQGTRSPRV